MSDHGWVVYRDGRCKTSGGPVRRFFRHTNLVESDSWTSLINQATKMQAHDATACALILGHGACVLRFE